MTIPVSRWADSLIREARRLLAQLTDEEFWDRAQKVRDVMKRARARGWRTNDEFGGSYGRAPKQRVKHKKEDPVFSRDFTPGKGLGWSKERYQQMWRLVREYAKQKNIDSIPRERKGVVFGGGSGTGKTSLRNSLVGDKALPELGEINEETYGIVDPDEFKAWGWQHGIFDHLKDRLPGIAPGEMADLIHEESSAMAKMYQLMLQQRGANVVIDKTLMGVDDDGKMLPDERNPAVKAVNQLVRAQYDPYGILIDAPPEFSHTAANGRYQNNARKWLGFEGMPGGTIPNTPRSRQTWEQEREDIGRSARMIDDSYILGQGRSPDPRYRSSASANFARVAPDPSGPGGGARLKKAWVYKPEFTPQGYSDPNPEYIPPPNWYGAHIGPQGPESARMAYRRIVRRATLPGGGNHPPADYGEACDWFRQGQIDFDTLKFALMTLPPPDDLPVGRDEGQCRVFCDINAAGLDTDCIEELHAADLIDLDELCELWEAVTENPNADMDPDAELGF